MNIFRITENKFIMTNHNYNREQFFIDPFNMSSRNSSILGIDYPHEVMKKPLVFESRFIVSY